MNLFMCASVAALGATTAALCMLILARRYREHHLLPLLAFLATSVAYRAVYLGPVSTQHEACVREIFYAWLVALYAGGVLWRMDQYLRRIAWQSALLTILAVSCACALAMLLPGAHPDYRGMIATALAPAILCVFALYGSRDPLDRAACLGLAWIFFAQAAHYVGWEFSFAAARFFSWIHTIATLWAMAEITAAARPGRPLGA